MRTVLRACAIALALASTGGCKSGEPNGSASAPRLAAPRAGSVSGEYHVEADAVLAPLATALSKAFEAMQPEATSTADAPAEAVVRLVVGEAPDGTKPVHVAGLRMVLVVPKGNPAGIAAFEELAGDKVRAIGMATEGSGGADYAQQALNSARLWPETGGKIKSADYPEGLIELLVSKQVDVAIVPGTFMSLGEGDETLRRRFESIHLLGDVPEDLMAAPACYAVTTKRSAPAAASFAEFAASADAEDAVKSVHLSPAMPAGQGTTLYVYAGAGLRMALQDVVEVFEQETGIEVDVGYAGSGCLLGQLNFAKKGDLYLPGELFYLDQAKERGYLDDLMYVASFIPVIMVEKGNPKGIQSLHDLTRPGLRIAIGERETVACGRAAQEILERAGIADEVRANVVLEGINVAELGNALKLRTVDVAIAWNATARLYEDTCEAIDISPEYAHPSEIYMGLLSFSKHEAEARKLMTMISSERGRRVFREWGYYVDERYLAKEDSIAD